MKKQGGFSYLEIVVSLAIIVSVIQIFFFVIQYTSKSYQSFREVEEATLYGKEALQYMLNLIETGEELDRGVLQVYKGSLDQPRQSYEYHCILIPEIPAGTRLTKEQLEQGMHFTSEETFDFSIFEKMYKENKLALSRPNYQEPAVLYYEGLSLESTQIRTAIVGQDKIIEQGKEILAMQVKTGGDKVRIEINPCGIALDEEKSIFVLWENAEYLGGGSLEVEWVNNTPCPIILGIVSPKEQIGRMVFSIQEGGKPLMVKRLSKKPHKEARYILFEAITKRVDKGYKVLKTYTVIK